MIAALIVPIGEKTQAIITEILYLLKKSREHKHLTIARIEVFSSQASLSLLKKEPFQQAYTQLCNQLEIPKPYLHLNPTSDGDPTNLGDDDTIQAYTDKILSLHDGHDKIIYCAKGGGKELAMKMGFVFTCISRDSDELVSIQAPNPQQIREDFYYPTESNEAEMLKLVKIDYVPLGNLFPKGVIAPGQDYRKIMRDIKAVIQGKLTLDIRQRTMQIATKAPYKLSQDQFSILLYFCVLALERNNEAVELTLPNALSYHKAVAFCEEASSTVEDKLRALGAHNDRLYDYVKYTYLNSEKLESKTAEVYNTEDEKKLASKIKQSWASVISKLNQSIHDYIEDSQQALPYSIQRSYDGACRFTLPASRIAIKL